MTAFESTKDAVSYTWNNNSTLRFCCKLITCPLFGPCYYIRSSDHPSCVKQTRGPSRKQLERYTVLAGVEHRRRVRRVGRKRIPSVDGEKWWNKKAKGQSQSPLFAKLPLELRLQIYEMVLCDQEELTMRFNEDQPWDRWKVRAEQGRDTKMLRTCKKMFVATLPFSILRNRSLTELLATARPPRCSTPRTPSNLTPTSCSPPLYQRYLRSVLPLSEKSFSSSLCSGMVAMILSRGTEICCHYLVECKASKRYV